MGEEEACCSSRRVPIIFLVELIVMLMKPLFTPAVHPAWARFTSEMSEKSTAGVGARERERERGRVRKRERRVYIYVCESE